MRPIVLQANPSPEDQQWRFTLSGALEYPRNPKPGFIYGKFIKFTHTEITIQIEKFPSNRILHADDPTKFILLSFGDFRFPNATLRDTGEYMTRMFSRGIFLDGKQYRFYHHSNSQLRGRSCFVREANNDAELDQRIYAFGDFGRIMNAAKRAKRIGLLFSEAQVDYVLDPRHVADIPDIKSGDELFSDGCGLISQKLAMQLSKKKKIIFRGKRYTPCVFQIRYRGYKGVLMLHLQLDKDNAQKRDTPDQQHFIEFRHSMKKFTATSNNTLSVVGYSTPFAFGRLNNDIVVLLYSLGVTKEKFLEKQQAYHDWIEAASTDPVKAFDFLSTLQDYPLAERVLLDGIEKEEVAKGIRAAQLREISSFKNERDKVRTRIIVQKSRLLYGVCDPFRVLKEGQVHVRITTPKGPSSLIYGDVLVVRNPCLHPGDCLKLRAVDHPKLSHLVDCLVFASVAKPGHHAAPSMSSGGDLDGDKFFVCWDSDIIPSTVAESYDYPPNKERPNKQIVRQDLANYFAMYNNSGLARIVALHEKWARASPKRALCSECQELNALHSQSVDGASVSIPDRLKNTPPVPESAEPYITTVLAEKAAEFANSFTQESVSKSDLVRLTTEQDAKALLEQLLTSKRNTFSEYEIFDLCLRIAKKSSFPLDPYVNYFDFGAFTADQKHAILSTIERSRAIDANFSTLNLTRANHPAMWNSMLRSDILTVNDLFQRSLHQPFSLQRLYSSKDSGLATFFSYLRRTVQDFTRKIILVKVDERLTVGIFMRGEIPWDEDPEVNDNVVICSFLPRTSSTFSSYRPCVAGYKLHCSDAIFQLYDRHVGNSFVYFQRRSSRGEGTEVAASIALQKISERVRTQVGRVYKTPISMVEMHVVSNRDRVAHHLFDLWFEHVSTQNRVKRFERDIIDYLPDTIPPSGSESEVAFWGNQLPWLRELFVPKKTEEDFNNMLANRTLSSEWDTILRFCLEYKRHDELFWTFIFAVSQTPLDHAFASKWIDKHPALTFALLQKYPPTEACMLPDETRPILIPIVRNIIRFANEFGVASLVALEKLSREICDLPFVDYSGLLWLSALSVRSKQLFQELMLVLNDARIADGGSGESALNYAHKYVLGVAFDRGEEAADECPCDDAGNPARQRTPPSQTTLAFIADKPLHVKAIIRVDARTPIRLHSHVRLQTAVVAAGAADRTVMDGIVTQAQKGELVIELMHSPPPDMEKLNWNMYNAGSIATSKAMLDAIVRLVEERSQCCSLYGIITGDFLHTQADTSDSNSGLEQEEDLDSHQNVSLEQPLSRSAPEDAEIFVGLNFSQQEAVNSCRALLSLIWGPPGTGKTTVVVRILWKLVQESKGREKILMTASTHNAVDNVLERFVRLNQEKGLLSEDKILRVATDVSKVNPNLHQYTIDARVGGETSENNRLQKQAEARVKGSIIVFTTCAGAGLGALRKSDFEIVLIDEASQITEPTALVPLVKGVKRAVLVGDHVQLRPTIKAMGKVLEFDISLLERLYKGTEHNGLSKTMLEVQYRFPQELARFPSQEFYQGRLRSGIEDSRRVLQRLLHTSFPWPTASSGTVKPTIFVPCTLEEDMGGRSKSNAGQVELTSRIARMLITTTDSELVEDNATPLTIIILSPYNKQITELRHRLPESVKAYTVDSFQGREADIIVFSSVRCNAEGEIGFLDDERRLNVMWTRARLGLIIVGDRRTVSVNALWKRALDSCEEVILPDLPHESATSDRTNKPRQARQSEQTIASVESELILLTGATGLLGSHLVVKLLKKGYRVRILCTAGKTSTLQSVYQNRQLVQIYPVPDIRSAQLSDALENVSAVIHTSYPLPERATKEEIIKAAEEGVMNIVRQASEAHIERVIVTTSIASVFDQYGSFTDQDWHPIATGEESLLSGKTSAYKAAGILAEKKLWEYASSHSQLDVTTFNVPTMYGPFSETFSITPASGSNAIPYQSLSTNAYIYRMLTKGKPPPDSYYIDVRDVANAHVLALKSPLSSEAGIGRKRLIMSSLQHFDVAGMLRMISDRRPALSDRISKLAVPTSESLALTFDIQRIEKLLGAKKGDLFTPLATTILQTVDSLMDVEKEWGERGITVDI